MTPDDIRRVMLRELDSVRAELRAYPDDASVWAHPAGLPNAGGTLALHLAGNLRAFIGAALGGTGYMRDRDAEFARRNVPRSELIAGIDAAVRDVDAVLGAIDATRLDAPFPVPLAGVQLPTGVTLIHLAVHLGYHLGQLDYHRRVVTGDATSVGTLSPKALASPLPA